MCLSYYMSCSTGIGILPVTWDGFHPSDYPLTNRLKAAVERQVQQETGEISR